MIEIKRSCNSSIRDDPVKASITFGAFTIKLTEEEYGWFDYFRNELNLEPVQMLQEFIDWGIIHLIKKEASE